MLGFIPMNETHTPGTESNGQEGLVDRSDNEVASHGQYYHLFIAPYAVQDFVPEKRSEEAGKHSETVVGSDDSPSQGSEAGEDSRSLGGSDDSPSQGSEAGEDSRSLGGSDDSPSQGSEAGEDSRSLVGSDDSPSQASEAGEDSRSLVGSDDSPSQASEAGEDSRSLGGSDDSPSQASDAGADSKSLGGSDECVFNPQVLVCWGRGRKNHAKATLEMALTLIRESPQPPFVRWEPNEKPLHFRLNGQLLLGKFIFESRARYLYAEDYVGEYYIHGTRDGFGMPGGVLELETCQVRVRPREREVPVNVYLNSDGNKVPNPGGESTQYLFSLAAKGAEGCFAPGSQTGPHTFDLLRDNQESDFRLTIEYVGIQREVKFSPEENQLIQRVTSESKWEVIENGEIFIDQPICVNFDPSDNQGGDVILLIFEIKNTVSTACNMKGNVRVVTKLGLSSNNGELKKVWLRKGTSNHSQLLNLRREVNQECHPIVVQDGTKEEQKVFCIDVPDGTEKGQKFKVEFDSSLIWMIEEGEIRDGKIFVDVSLEFLIQPDGKEEEESRSLSIKREVWLKEILGAKWLCIDFGTSAIAAALGDSDDGSIDIEDLQFVKTIQANGKSPDHPDPGEEPWEGGKTPDFSLAKMFPNNIEFGTPFLPSWTMADADLREQTPDPETVQFLAGSPKALGASLCPGDASFLSLPAPMERVREYPGRVIFSLKSWLGSPNQIVKLAEKISCKLEGKKMITAELPLLDTVRSGFSALATGVPLR